MAPRARGRLRERVRTRAARVDRNAASRSRSLRPRSEDAAGVPDVFRDMMHEVAGEGNGAAHGEVEEGQEEVKERPRKRARRIDARLPPRMAVSSDIEETNEDRKIARPLQEIEATTDEEEDLEFEDVELGGGHNTEHDTDPEVDSHLLGQEGDLGEGEGISIAPKRFDASTPARARRKRRPVTSAEKAMRLTVHKMHIMYLLYHVFYRNGWCNDEVVRAMLRPTISSRVIQLLNPSDSASQAQSSTFFLLGLSQISESFCNRWRISSLGLRRPQWAASPDEISNFKLDEKAEKPTELADFRRAANSMTGSADLGAQVFCAMLRAVGVQARLVCSLQVLGLGAAADVGFAATKTSESEKRTVYLSEGETNSRAEPASPSLSRPFPTPGRISRIGQPNAGSKKRNQRRPPSDLPDSSVRIDRPPYPVFWVEAFNAAYQKWVCVDPLATRTVNKPWKLEPGLVDPRNSMSYVIAFEEDGVARDITRRYTKAYNAKTRKIRVETVSEGGIAWLRRAMKIFRRPIVLNRDRIEDAELVAKDASEGMPNNIQDFKGHPIYALERHLRRDEVVHPKVESGRINAGTARDPRFEIVYRRVNVHIVKSSDKWFRLGREIKIGEQPLKHAKPRRGTRGSSFGADDEEVGAGMYAAFQTQVYVPPSVENGRLPKNMYGNIDIYVPSMIPEGAVWIRLPSAKAAAKTMGIDYADAVTGFDFKGRRGTARIDGVVIAEEHFEAIEFVIKGLREKAAWEMDEARRREALRLWRRFLVGLRISERIEGYRDAGDDVHGEERRRVEEDVRMRMDQDMDEQDEYSAGGGFLTEGEDGDQSRPRAVAIRDFAEGGGDGNMLAESDGEDEHDGGGGGGFLPESDDEAYDDETYEPAVDEQSETASVEASPTAESKARTSKLEENSNLGFASIQVPTLNNILNYGNSERLSDLPTVIRGGKHRATDAVIDQDVILSDHAIESVNGSPENPLAVQDSPLQEATDVKDFSEHMVTDVEEEPVERLQSDIGDHNDEHARKTASLPSPTPPVDAASVSSTSGYDDDMLLEDPEDEDAEPEWLI